MKQVYDRNNNVTTLVEKDDFKIVKLFEGEYKGNSLLELNTNIPLDKYSEIILISSGSNPYVFTVHTIPYDEFIYEQSPSDPMLFFIDKGFGIYMYRYNQKAIYMFGLNSINENIKIVKILGISKP